MDLFQLLAPRLIFILGVTNFLLLLLLYLTCRCTPPTRPGRWLMRHKSFKKLFGYHCYFWWGLWASVTIHLVIAVGFMGIPF